MHGARVENKPAVKQRSRFIFSFKKDIMATKFISPFVSDATEGEGADEGDLTIPDALLLNDSLDEGVDSTALLDDALLPTECAAAEPKPRNFPQKELNDSLSTEDLDETQLPVSDGDLTQATVEKEVATSVEPNAAEPQPDSNKEQSKLTPRMSSSSSVEMKANANLEEKTELASTTEPQASKAMAKVKPSFGKKKKGFTPPKMITKAAPNTTDQSKSNTKPVKASDQGSSNATDKSPPQNSPENVAYSSKPQPANDTDSEVKTTSEKMPSTEEKMAKVTDKKMSVEDKKREKEKKEQERALKKQALEQKKIEREKKKAELERQQNEKRLELERKKAEREQKKMEKELKKMEREQKKAEKQQAKASQKKQQTKDKKTEDTSGIEESIKKDDTKPMEDKGRDTEHESKVNEGTDETDVAVKSEELETDQEKENIPPVGEKQSSVVSTKDAVAALSPVASHDDKTKKPKEKLSPQKKGDDQQKNEVGMKEKEKISGKEAGNSNTIEHEELAKNTPAVASLAVSKPTELSRDRTTKQKEKKLKKFSPPKAKKESGKEVKKQRKPAIKMNRVEKSGSDVNKKTQADKEKKRKRSVYSDSEDELEPKREKPINHFGSVWVQCENANCKKWRLLRECDDPAKVPGKWVCSMNTDPDHNSCLAEEEQWSDLGDSQEFIESPFIPGSLVWSKMDGYPWWPAMIEEDPNKETYYELGYRDSPIPVRYHVVFFDTPVSRGWVSSLHTLPYTGENDPNKDGNVNVPQRLKRTLTEGKKQANKALGLSVKERLETLGFAKRFRGSRRKRQAEDSPEAVPSQSKFRKTTSSGERKSARLRVSVEEETMPVVSLKPLQNQQPDSEEVVSTDTKESDDNSLMRQHEA